VGIDAREGRVAIHGWLETVDVRAVDLAPSRWRAQGVERIVYTDMQRDGMLTGVNVEATRRNWPVPPAWGHRLWRRGLAGGCARLASKRRERRIEGVIIGMALYRGTLTAGAGTPYCQRRNDMLAKRIIPAWT
jgi:phosphoribosylformimino-5-aminoimidazole carboxamide ribotide isomerase